jgi:hypothetical protein
LIGVYSQGRVGTDWFSLTVAPDVREYDFEGIRAKVCHEEVMGMMGKNIFEFVCPCKNDQN